MKSKLLHPAFEVILNPFSNASQPGLDCVNSKAEKLRCHSLLAGIAADAPERKDISCPMHVRQTARTCCRCMMKNENMNDRTCYSPRSVYEVMQKNETVEKPENNLKLSILKKDSSKIRVLKKEINNVLREVPTSARQSSFEKSYFV